MSAEALLRACDAAFNAGDRDAMAGLLTEEAAHDVNQGAHETGRALLEPLARHDREPVEGLVGMATTDGTRAAAGFTIAGACLALRDGRIARGTDLGNRRDRIAQASASQP